MNKVTFFWKQYLQLRTFGGLVRIPEGYVPCSLQGVRSENLPDIIEQCGDCMVEVEFQFNNLIPLRVYIPKNIDNFVEDFISVKKHGENFTRKTAQLCESNGYYNCLWVGEETFENGVRIKNENISIEAEDIMDYIKSQSWLPENINEFTNETFEKITK